MSNKIKILLIILGGILAIVIFSKIMELSFALIFKWIF